MSTSITYIYTEYKTIEDIFQSEQIKIVGFPVGKMESGKGRTAREKKTAVAVEEGCKKI